MPMVRPDTVGQRTRAFGARRMAVANLKVGTAARRGPSGKWRDFLFAAPFRRPDPATLDAVFLMESNSLTVRRLQPFAPERVEVARPPAIPIVGIPLALTN